MANSSAETASKAVRTHNSGNVGEVSTGNEGVFGGQPGLFQLHTIHTNSIEMCELGTAKDLKRGSQPYESTNVWDELKSV